MKMWVAITATLAAAAGMLLVAAPPAGAIHLTSITLSSVSVPLGTPNAVLPGVVNSPGDPASCDYGWTLTPSVGVASPSSSPPLGPTVTNYTLTVATGALPAGVYDVSVAANWDPPAGCVDGPDGVAKAQITITGRLGTFSCRAVAGRLGSGHYAMANAPLTPCQDDAKWSTTLPIGTVANLNLASAVTDQTPDNLNATPPAFGDNATAAAGAGTVNVRVGPVRIALTAVSAQASARCSAFGIPGVTSSSQVVGLRINNGVARTVTGYLRISLLGVTIELNKTTATLTSRTQQALVVSSIYTVGKLVIGEATAGYTGNPCVV